MKKLHYAGVLLSAVLGVGACGGDSVSVGDFPAEFSDAFCSRMVRCNAYTSKAACLESINLDVGQIQQSIAAGRVAYDGEAMAECIDAFAASSCDGTSRDVRETPQACLEAIKGKVADGGACFDDGECVSDSCNIADCGQACCQGSCDATVAEAAIGASCATARCVNGSFCSDANVCTALLAAGAACAGNDECTYGLTCANDVCTAAANRGDTCIPDGECSDIGDRCDTASNKCVALSALGGACSEGFAGLFDCQRPLVCNGTTLKCENPPAVGQACEFFCAPGSFCNDQSTCEAVRANGAACQSDSECDSDFCDDSGATGVCAANPVCG